MVLSEKRMGTVIQRNWYGERQRKTEDDAGKGQDGGFYEGMLPGL